jgi:hypothetical protein
MIIAQEKRKTNLAEYILYMWQIEDLIRAYKFDITAITEAVLQHFKQPEEKQIEIKEWYENLIEMMKVEKVEEKGHLQIIKNNIDELFDFHMHLLNNKKDSAYIALFQKSVGHIAEFRTKSQATEEDNDIELCLTALYGILMLRLQKKEISKDTLAAISSFSEMIASLTAKYKAFEEDKD